jgi:hypothetical protein
MPSPQIERKLAAIMFTVALIIFIPIAWGCSLGWYIEKLQKKEEEIGFIIVGFHKFYFFFFFLKFLYIPSQ